MDTDNNLSYVYYSLHSLQDPHSGSILRLLPTSICLDCLVSISPSSCKYEAGFINIRLVS